MQEEQARKHYVKLKTLRSRAQELQEQMEEIDEKTVELREMIDAVQEAQTLTDEDELLVPLTNGVYIPAKALRTDKLYLNVGAQTVITKGPAEAKELLESQQAELTQYRERIKEQRGQVLNEAERVEKQVRESMNDV